MTYLQFHLVFVLPAIVALVAACWIKRGAPTGGYGRWIALICLIAFVYTTPWDNYLVAREVWWYSEDRVIGTIGYVPIEEYLFFLLQPILTGLWLALLPKWTTTVSMHERTVQTAGGLLALAISVAGFWMLGRDTTFYMGLILAWAGPVVAGQWAWYGGAFVRHFPRWALGIGIPTLYLWIADWVAIDQQIWVIAPNYTTGLHLFGLPIEEATFFLVTNVMVVQGILMFTERVRRPATVQRSAAPAS